MPGPTVRWGLLLKSDVTRDVDFIAWIYTSEKDARSRIRERGASRRDLRVVKITIEDTIEDQ